VLAVRGGFHAPWREQEEKKHESRRHGFFLIGWRPVDANGRVARRSKYGFVIYHRNIIGAPVERDFYTQKDYRIHERRKLVERGSVSYTIDNRACSARDDPF
jgi:hypothetical protein